MYSNNQPPAYNQRRATGPPVPPYTNQVKTYQEPPKKYKPESSSVMGSEVFASDNIDLRQKQYKPKRLQTGTDSTEEDNIDEKDVDEGTAFSKVKIMEKKPKQKPKTKNIYDRPMFDFN